MSESHNCPEVWRAKTRREEPPSYEFKVTYQPSRATRFRFSQTEIRDLTLSALLVSGVGLSLLGFGILGSPVIIVAMLVAVFTASFFIHEMAHKFVAQRFGLWAEFRLTLTGAILTLISIISPFKIISPGAVMIAGAAGTDTVGKTAIAGPVTNLVICGISFALTLLLPSYSFPFEVALFSAAFNAFIAALNLIPFGMFDGWKIFQWSKLIWALSFASAVLLLGGILILNPGLIQL